jgi:O-antigen/teichoic acid export membrane protein
VYENYKTGHKKIKKIHYIISFLMIAAALVIIFCQDLVYIILVDKQFWESKEIFPLLLLSPVCITISETLGFGIEISKKTILKIPVYLISIIINYILCIILLPRFGVVGAASATAVSSIAMLFTKALIGDRFYKCCDNYWKVTVAIIFLTTAGIVNIILFSSSFKYLIYAVLMVALNIIYKNEVKLLINYSVAWRN